MLCIISPEVLPFTYNVVYNPGTAYQDERWPTYNSPGHYGKICSDIRCRNVFLVGMQIPSFGLSCQKKVPGMSLVD